MKLSTEQLEQILGNAPIMDWTHYCTRNRQYIKRDGNTDMLFVHTKGRSVLLSGRPYWLERRERLEEILALRKRVEELEAQVQNYPMQPLVVDAEGVLRFEANPIVEWLATEVSDMNQIAAWAAKNNVPNKYKQQLAQLVGYSVRGYGTLSYVVSDEFYNRAIAAYPQPPKEKDNE